MIVIPTPEPTPVPTPDNWWKEEVFKLTDEAGMNREIVENIIKCESGWNPKAVGDGGKSWGIWQIYSVAHPEMTKEVAFNPIRSTQYAVKLFEQRGYHPWSCARILGII